MSGTLHPLFVLPPDSLTGSPPRTKRSSVIHPPQSISSIPLVAEGWLCCLARGCLSPTHARHFISPCRSSGEGSVDRFLRSNRHDHKVTELFCFLFVGSALPRFSLILDRSISRVDSMGFKRNFIFVLSRRFICVGILGDSFVDGLKLMGRTKRAIVGDKANKATVY